MACGIPIVAPNTTTFPEVIGFEALLYKPEDPKDLAEKVITLLTNSGLYNSVKEYLLTRVHEYFDIRKIAKNT
jgi:glycosyltransferase involved in cell wall biosynthesis